MVLPSRRPTKKPSKFYDVSDKEGAKGQALKWDIPADAIQKDGESASRVASFRAYGRARSGPRGRPKDPVRVLDGEAVSPLRLGT